MIDVSMKEVLGLPVERRLQIVQTIWDSIVGAPEDLPLTEDEKQELERRLASASKNPEASRSWNDVKERLLKEV